MNQEQEGKNIQTDNEEVPFHTDVNKPHFTNESLILEEFSTRNNLNSKLATEYISRSSGRDLELVFATEPGQFAKEQVTATDCEKLERLQTI